MTIKGTIVFTRNLNAYEDGKRFIINQGGSRSSKTYSILQLLIYLAKSTPRLEITLIRKTFPAVRESVLKDFFDILRSYNLYNEYQHNKTHNTYQFLNGSIFKFQSIDEAQKVRGQKRDICYCNEANELLFDDFIQLNLRTNKTLFFDFNPSESDHWLYDLLKREESILIKSTYKNNRFLEENIVKEIDNLVNVDENYYKVFALGERSLVSSKVYSHFRQYTDDIKEEDYCYGLDFGYTATHFCALVKVSYFENRIYVKELLYKTGLTITDLVRELKTIIKDGKPIYCDSARPDIIEELRRNAFNAQQSNKSVKEGIDYIRSKEILTHIESINLWKEYRNYMYKTNGDKVLEDVIKYNDDCMDAMRYAINSHKKKMNQKKYVGFFN